MKAELRDAGRLYGGYPGLPEAIPVALAEHEPRRVRRPAPSERGVRVRRELDLTWAAVLRLSEQNDAPRAIDAIPGQPERLATAHAREHRELD
jgi:hypothetical protein